MPDPDKRFLLLVYYDSTGCPTVQRRVSASAVDLSDHHAELMREGRDLDAGWRRRSMHLERD